MCSGVVLYRTSYVASALTAITGGIMMLAAAKATAIAGGVLFVVGLTVFGTLECWPSRYSTLCPLPDQDDDQDESRRRISRATNTMARVQLAMREDLGIPILGES